ncbi:RICIN domain-containing protein [Solirubrobacter soli]|uniref:RICIN domain-containing protein n=1 Tax=Solirubrobacter soli TaxID=363832 RepID=UPI0004014700|nr:RICIN domain-containing protein [Solirubrobacter soli]
MKALLITALATALLVFASTANAATTNVRIANPVASGKLLTALPSGAVEMRFAGGQGQVWAKTGVAPGFVSFASLGRCLTGRSPSLVTVDPCTGSRNQQWRTDSDGFVFNRGLGLALEVGTSPIAPGVRLAPFTGLANQRWLQKPA